jgi:hypothetical protein
VALLCNRASRMRCFVEKRIRVWADPRGVVKRRLLPDTPGGCLPPSGLTAPDSSSMELSMSEVSRPPSGPFCGSPDPSLALSPAEASLLRYLVDHGEADSLSVRRDLAMANISATARAVSLKLAAAGDPRRVECLTGSVFDPAAGRHRPVARWRLIVPTTTLAA